jgi:hypothetical protein
MFSHEQLNRLLLSSSDPEDKRPLETNSSASLGSQDSGARGHEASPNMANRPRRIAILRFEMKTREASPVSLNLI